MASRTKQAGRKKKTGLRLEWRSPSELAANPANWRRHPARQVAALADVISEVGWAGACLYNERTGRLIDGHARREVAIEKGEKVVPVLIGNWSEADERKILATLDPIANQAEVDPDALAALLELVETESDAVQVLLDRLLAGDLVDAEGEWRGMPESVNEDQTPFRTIRVHFKNKQAVVAFAKAIRQTLSDNTHWIWFPPVPIEIAADKTYASRRK
jgi:ParB-like chromosome segregation protein Spo0J